MAVSQAFCSSLWASLELAYSDVSDVVATQASHLDVDREGPNSRLSLVAREVYPLVSGTSAELLTSCMPSGKAGQREEVYIHC